MCVFIRSSQIVTYVVASEQLTHAKSGENLGFFRHRSKPFSLRDWKPWCYNPVANSPLHSLRLRSWILCERIKSPGTFSCGGSS